MSIDIQIALFAAILGFISVFYALFCDVGMLRSAIFGSWLFGGGAIYLVVTAFADAL